MGAERLPRPEPPDLSGLSGEHQRELLEESANSPEAVAARGYRTITRLADVPDVFPKWQRRLGLLVPTFSPDNQTRGYQLKPKNRIRRKDGTKPKYETAQASGVTLDVNPLMLDEVRNGTGDLYVTEGAKKVDALASWGLPAVGVIGVHNFAVKGTKGTVPLPCWRHINLNGRTVIIVYDADSRTNSNVQLGLARAVKMLEALGACVLVVYLPPVNGDDKAGVDNYKAGGGSKAELRLMARPFEPVDVGAERLTKNEKLRAVVEGLWTEWRAMPARKMAECTDRAVMRELVRAVPRNGKLQAEGVLVIDSMRDIAKGAQTSIGAVKKSLDRMVKEGRLRREFWGRSKDKPGAYLLLTPWRVGRALREHKGEKERPEGKVGQERETFSPLSNASYDPGVHATRAPSEDVPALRWPKVVLTWERREGKRVVVDAYYVARLGKRREEIIRHVLEAGGDTTGVELLERFGGKTARLRDFRRRMLGPIEAEDIITITGDNIALTDRWRAALEEARERTEELRDARLQAQKYERQKKEFKEWLASGIEADPTPELPGREKMRQIVREAAKRDEAARIEEQRRKVGKTAEVFIYDQLASLGRVRLGLLQELWAGEGGNPGHIWYAARKMRCRIEKLPEHGNALFVFPPEQQGGDDPPDRLEPAKVVPLRYREAEPESNTATVAVLKAAPAAVLPEPEPHSAFCDCPSCGYPEPSYARPWGSA